MNLGELIDILSRIRADHGDGPVVISDADTAWEMPIDSIEKTADNHYLLNGVGYVDGVEPSLRPLVAVWRDGDERPSAPESVEYATLRDESGRERRVVILSAALYERMVGQWSAAVSAASKQNT